MRARRSPSRPSTAARRTRLARTASLSSGLHLSSTRPTSTSTWPPSGSSHVLLPHGCRPRPGSPGAGVGSSESNHMERIAFAMKLLPGAEAEYRRRHAAVWPEMLEALRAAGARNYSIYLRGDDLFGVLEVDDFARFRAMMDGDQINTRWQAEMASLIDPCIDPATGFHRRLDEVFRLD